MIVLMNMKSFFFSNRQLRNVEFEQTTQYILKDKGQTGLSIKHKNMKI